MWVVGMWGKAGGKGVGAERALNVALVEFKFVATNIMMENGAALFVQSQWRRKQLADHFRQIRWCATRPADARHGALDGAATQHGAFSTHRQSDEFVANWTIRGSALGDREWRLNEAQRPHLCGVR
jgi:hypothetical protein